MQSGAKKNQDPKEESSWAWTLWEAKVPLPESIESDATYALVARASKLHNESIQI